MTRMMFKGILQEVIVDDMFPVTHEKENNEVKDQLLACRPSRNSSEIYVMILEKCWAKLWGSYDRIDGK
jgi:hypothetical protein